VTTSPDAGLYYRDRYWNELPAVVEHLNRRATGAPHPGWMHHLLAHHDGRPFRCALVLNAGNGWVERELVDLGVVESAVGIEHAPALVARARAEAGGRPLRYLEADVNDVELPGGVDLVVNHAAGHHITYIDRVFRRVARVLPPDGVFVHWDYVGPHRNQYPAGMWEAAWQLNRELPEAYRSPMVYDHVPSMVVGDPTEAVHSELVLPVLRRYFHIDHFAALGGAMGYLLLTHNPALLDAPPEVRDPLVARILAADEAWVERDPSSTLFAYVLARPRHEVLADTAQLAAWTDEEEAREALARANGGRYHPPTLVHSLLYPEPDPTPAGVAGDATVPSASGSPVRAELRRRLAAVPGARPAWRWARDQVAVASRRAAPLTGRLRRRPG